MPAAAAHHIGLLPAVRQEPRDDCNAHERALAAISVRNHKEALPILRHSKETWDDEHVPAVYIAQLDGDVEALEKTLGDLRVRDTALLALKRMRREDVLRKIADDEQHAARVAARAVLDGKLGP